MHCKAMPTHLAKKKVTAHYKLKGPVAWRTYMCKVMYMLSEHEAVSRLAVGVSTLST